MYGYIRTYAPELKVREQEYYRAVYCGLCRTMGKCTGQCSRFALSYDFTFFALVRMALTEEPVTFRTRRCAAHPLRKRPMAEPNEALHHAAYLSSILAYHKVRDDLADERGLKRTAATLVRPYLSSLRRKAKARGYAEMDAQVSAALRALSDLEAARPPSVDDPADLFGNLMACLLSNGLTGNCARLATVIGHHIGRWIYILDAADDFEEDRKEGRYNPFVCLYTDLAPDETKLPAERRESIRLSLLSELAAVERAFDLMDTNDSPDLAGVLKNILYFGLPQAADRILCDACEACATREDDNTSVAKQKRSRRKHKPSARK